MPESAQNNVFFQYRQWLDGASGFPYVEALPDDPIADLIRAAQEDGQVFLSAVHSEDVQVLKHAITESARTLRSWSLDFRLNHPNSDTVWLTGKAHPEQQIDGSCIWSGYFTDITERRRIDESLKASEDFVRSTLDASLSHICVLNKNGEIVAVNQAWRDFLLQNTDKAATEGLIGSNYLHTCDCATGDFSEEASSVADGIRRVITGTQDHFQLEYPCHSPKEQRWFNVRVSRFRGQSGNVVVSHENITERKLTELRERHRNQILQMLADRVELRGILESSVRDLERNDPRIICSILLLSNDGRRLLHGAAPSLPEFYCDAIDGLVIGPGVGSCGTAAFSKKLAIVEDIATHPWWEPFRDPAERAGLKSCWSQPIVSSSGAVLGTFATYHRMISTPTAHDIAVIENEARLIALAIESTKSEANLQLAASVFSHAREGIFITDPHGVIIDVNETFSRITGFSREEAVGKKPSILHSGSHNSEFYAEMWGTLLKEKYWCGELWNRRKNGQIYAEMLTISAVDDSAGDVRNYVALFTDVTLMKEHEHELEHIAHYDVLTGLPNRVLLSDRLQQAIAQTQRNSMGLAVVFLDLDGFKNINDTYGHNAGDQLLIALAQRMKASLREGDTLARIGGDEFVAIMVGLEKNEDCQPILERLLHAASSPVNISGTDLSVTASLGVTSYPQDGVDADVLIRHADQAMYVAKQAGKNRFHFFDVAHDAAITTLQQDLKEVERGISEGQFVLHYQPKVDLRSGELLGLEALIRWNHPARGLLLPAAFLPQLEHSSLMVTLGDYVIHKALTQIQLWAGQGLVVPVSVNLSARQLQKEGFTSHLERIFQAHPGIPYTALEFEILESSALNDIAHARQVLDGCIGMGIRFSLDDFGTGYSSLTHLKALPAHTIKIDQSFVRGMIRDPSDKAIVEGIIGLANAFNRYVVAEGVEDEPTGALLLSMGCKVAQGYTIAPPMPPEQIKDWKEKWRPYASWQS